MIAATENTWDLSKLLANLIPKIKQVGTETLDVGLVVGRIASQNICLDRPSPACNVSAVDGFAVPSREVIGKTWEISGEITPGVAPPLMNNNVWQIYTGAAVPKGCWGIIPREQVLEQSKAINIPGNVIIHEGQNIRFQGENGHTGDTLRLQGRPIEAPAAAALGAFGYQNMSVFRRVRVRVIVTGDEIQSKQILAPWELRDSNGPVLHAMWSRIPWIELLPIIHIRDDLELLQETVAQCLDGCDALLLTGGVSAGNYDWVPTALTDAGATILFHKLPIRPGKPILGGVGKQGQLIIGLPGNPAAVMTTARWIVVPLVRHLAGFHDHREVLTQVWLEKPAHKLMPLLCLKPVKWINENRVRLITTKGSGDIVNIAISDGFVQIPPGQVGNGPFWFYPWSMR